MTARRKIDDELRASEAKYSGILAIAADAIITIDQAQRIVHFNNGAETIFGYKAPDAIGRHLAILLPPRFRAGHDAHIENFARSPVTARRMGERREIFGLRVRRHRVSRRSVHLKARDAGRTSVHGGAA